MSEVKIESNIPLTPQDRHKGAKGGGKWQKLLKSMGIGDSVLVSASRANQLRQTAHRLKIKIAIRRQPDNSYRVWKLEEK